jgi:hypothetical protein
LLCRVTCSFARTEPAVPQRCVIDSGASNARLPGSTLPLQICGRDAAAADVREGIGCGCHLTIRYQHRGLGAGRSGFALRCLFPSGLACSRMVLLRVALVLDALCPMTMHCVMLPGIGSGARVASAVAHRCRGSIVGCAFLSYPLEASCIRYDRALGPQSSCQHNQCIIANLCHVH